MTCIASDSSRIICAIFLTAGLATSQQEILKISPPAGTFFGTRMTMDDGVGLARGLAGVHLVDMATGLELQHLLRVGGNNLEIYGRSLALDRGLAVVGAPGATVNVSGAVYVFDVTTGVQLHRILSPSPLAGDFFGQSVSIDDGRILVGASGAGSFAHDGAAYLFDAQTGQLLLEYSPSISGDFANFGESVSIDGDLVLVGSPFADAAGGTPGHAFLFDASSGQQLAALTGAGLPDTDLFGRAVAVNSSFLLIASRPTEFSAPGDGEVFVFDSNTHAESFRTYAPTPEPADQFGWALDLDGAQAVIGAPGGMGIGRAHVLDLSTGNFLFDVAPSDGTQEDFFGVSVAMENGVVAAGSPGNDNGGSDRGALYIYSLDLLGTSVCATTLNSTGEASVLVLAGSRSLAAQNLTLSASNAPAGRPALFFAGPTPTQTPFGDGFLCVGASGLLRLGPPVFESGGQFQLNVDFAGSGAALVPGVTYFQCWFRDSGGAGFDLSDSVMETLIP